MRRATARVMLLAFAGAVALLSFGGTAWAHAGGLTSSASEPVVLGIEPLPAAEGLTVRPVEFGARLLLENGTSATVTVLPPPGDVRPVLLTVPPGQRGFWTDPRVTSAAAHPAPDGRVPWAIPLTVGATPVTVHGEQRWPPPPNAALWWVITAACVALPSAVVALTSRRGPTALSRGTVALATGVVMAAHIVHIYGSSLVPVGGSLPLVFLAAAGFAVIGWPLGIAGAWLTMRGRPAGPLLCCVAGALLAIIIAPADVFSFHDAVVPFAWGADLDRALIALTVGGGLGVLFAAWILLRRTPASEASPERLS